MQPQKIKFNQESPTFRLAHKSEFQSYWTLLNTNLPYWKPNFPTDAKKLLVHYNRLNSSQNVEKPNWTEFWNYFEQ